MAEYLTEVVVRDDSPLVGQQVQRALVETEFDVDLLQLIRGESSSSNRSARRRFSRATCSPSGPTADTLVELLDVGGLDLVPDVEVDDAELEPQPGGKTSLR